MRDLLARDPAMAAAFGVKRVIGAWEKGFDPILRSAPAFLQMPRHADCPGLGTRSSS